MEENNSSILVVDDNPEIREIIQVLLGGEGYLVETAGNGVKALEMLSQREYDLIILDIMMPGLDGYQTCRKMREESNAPILFLSARTKDSDKTLGFSSGGDDYLAKPFSYNELISRAKALIRRYQVYRGKEEQTVKLNRFSCRNLIVDEETKNVYSDGELLELTDTEYAILLLLLKNRHQVFSAERLYEAVWKESFYYGAENTVMVWFYHRVRFIYPYCIFSLTVSIGLFFTVILFFIKKKMNLVAELKDEILRMAAGNLRDSVPNMGQDEIGIIAEELDNLRAALQDTLVREKESRRANQDLITAMSHDLRTPLTILNGYLEVLRLNRNPEMHEEYLKRCLQKTSDIREMTDRMFEYALVFEEGEEPKVKEIPIKFFRDCINEHSDFIRLAGFQTEMEYTYVERWITGDKGMIKRILSNLFSNILKYGDKSSPVFIKGSFTKQSYILEISNTVKQQNTGVESNHIGLMSVEKMMHQLGGESTFSEKNGSFSVELKFSLVH